MIYLRNLKEKDVPFMLEWMRDEDYKKYFQKDMDKISIENVKKFCVSSIVPEEISNGDSIHFAIANKSDEYLGTISLKNIDLQNNSAEYAISTRKCAQGKNIAKEATYQLFHIAFEKYKLHRVYLNVLKDNIHAIKFYKKCGFIYEGESRDVVCKNGIYKSLEWYSILENEYK